ncbi:MAG: putative metal-binding motif-containing protein [Deltaproteobacteria bacterium]|nr:putative metal-binding motif-containing protein [Deltaproteobacteria bacterium]
MDEDVGEDADGVTTCEGDCDDRFSAVKPGAAEVCDGSDNDCNGLVDEGYDQDGDRAMTCVGGAGREPRGGGRGAG